MNLQANKTDGKVLPLSNRRISAEEWNQLAASCMAFITAAGLTPDASDNEQFLNAFKAIAADLELVGANTNLSNLTASGQAKFDAKADKNAVRGMIFPDYSNGKTITIPEHGVDVWTAPSNGWISVLLAGSYMNGYRLYAGDVIIFQNGDDLNSNTKSASGLIPVAVGTQLSFDNGSWSAFETVATKFYPMVDE